MPAAELYPHGIQSLTFLDNTERKQKGMRRLHKMADEVEKRDELIKRIMCLFEEVISKEEQDAIANWAEVQCGCKPGPTRKGYILLLLCLHTANQRRMSVPDMIAEMWKKRSTRRILIHGCAIKRSA